MQHSTTAFARCWALLGPDRTAERIEVADELLAHGRATEGLEHDIVSIAPSFCDR